MDEYQIVVSRDGVTLFRTEWDADVERALANVVMLHTTMLLATVHVTSRGVTLRSEPALTFIKRIGG